VFELMRTFKLPGWDTFNNIIPYERDDDNKPEPRKPKKGKKKTKKQLAAEATDPSLIEPEEPEDPPRRFIPEEEVGMGGEEGRVYWPPGMEEWLRPKKREVKKKGEEAVDEETGETDGWAMKHPTPMNLKQRQRIKAEKDKGKKTDEGTADEDQEGDQPGPKRPAAAVKKSTPKRGKPSPKTEPESEPELSSAESDDADADAHGSDFSAEETDRTVLSMKTNGSVRRTGRKSAGKGGSYKESPDGASASEMDLD
jgi:UV DNA damage endonuclease